MVLFFGIFLLFSASMLTAIHQVIIRNIYLVAAVAAAMPDHKPLCVPLIRGAYCSQSPKALTGDVGRSIILRAHAAAMCLAPRYQLRCRGLTGISAAAQTCPVRSHLCALFASSNHFQIAEGLT